VLLVRNVRGYLVRRRAVFKSCRAIGLGIVVTSLFLIKTAHDGIAAALEVEAGLRTGFLDSAPCLQLTEADTGRCLDLIHGCSEYSSLTKFIRRKPQGAAARS
jgi:hypothetical protein